MLKFYFPMDIFEHVTSLARASSRVSKNDEEPEGPLHVSRRLPARGDNACISTFRWRH